ncbi:MAG TPA: Hsp33 family molecular chaperone HslO [Clostridia bacterium]|jgi:molecular chaperone Hsp33|nr:Hsp33 family molecular chaperone HslO [Clostridia bacterium]
MSDRLVKGIIFGGKARVAVIKITDIVNEEIKIHALSPLACAALGRAMTAGAYISTNLKSESNAFSIVINGGGELGNIIIAGEGGNHIRGCVQNPTLDLPVKEDGHLDVGKAVGKDGFITVIKDLGLKEPYVGKCELASGEIAEDFAKYLLVSEGVRSAVALGVKVNASGCLGAGGIIIEALPDLDNEDQLFMLEDIVTNFANISDIIAQKGPEEIFDFYFGPLDAEMLPAENITLRCACSDGKIEGIVKSIGEKEARDIINELGKIEVVCQFCEKRYTYTLEDVDKIWEK